MKTRRFSSTDEQCQIGRAARTDARYLENMASAIFRIGFSRTVVEAKWPQFLEAFESFAVDAVARFGPRDVSRLMADRGIIRNQEKIEAVIENARVLRGMRSPFRIFVAEILQKRGEAGLIEELGRRFQRLGPMTSLVFLRMSGHEMPETMAVRRALG